MRPINLSSLLPVSNLSSNMKRVDKGIADSLSSASPSIDKQLSRISKVHGKRLRPHLILSIASSHMTDISDAVISACTAVELVHLGSLVHDDIIDNAKTRWGVATINKLEGNNSAILAGDYLLAKACEEGSKISAEAAGKIAASISRMCEGQSLELSDQFNLGRKKESYIATIKGKTAELFSTTCELAAISSKLGDKETESYKKFGFEFGMSFQLLDDLIDLLSTSELLGKSVNKDIKEGVYTMPVLLSLESQYKDEIKILIKKSSNSRKLTDLLIQTGSIQEVIKAIKRHNKLASESIAGTPGEDNLTAFPEAYTNLIVDKLIDPKYKNKLLFV